FMDIELSDGRSFEIFQQVTITTPVIFITAYDHFAIKAIKLNALDYLLKPIDKEELENAILKVKKTNNVLKQDYSHLNQAFIRAVSGEKPKKLVVYDSAGARFIDIEKIIRLRADSNYTNIHLSSGEHITSSRTLKAYEELLVGLSFFRVSNAYIINLACVDKYIKGIGGSLIMNDGTTIEVSRLRKKGLLEALSLNH
ncbi:MAG TPA: LytTR family DNA-binding domain-containing protein, partial [Bacteroidia bacterium]|nr:LytTR family DNA-binding domain-containing protein [Bacteroidia bacterium]